MPTEIEWIEFYFRLLIGSVVQRRYVTRAQIKMWTVRNHHLSVVISACLWHDLKRHIWAAWCVLDCAALADAWWAVCVRVRVFVCMSVRPCFSIDINNRIVSIMLNDTAAYLNCDVLHWRIQTKTAICQSKSGKRSKEQAWQMKCLQRKINEYPNNIWMPEKPFEFIHSQFFAFCFIFKTFHIYFSIQLRFNLLSVFQFFLQLYLRCL